MSPRRLFVIIPFGKPFMPIIARIYGIVVSRKDKVFDPFYYDPATEDLLNQVKGLESNQSSQETDPQEKSDSE